MEQIKVSSEADKVEIYRELLPQLESLVSGESDFIANASNLSAALKQALPHASWVGFYFMKEGELVVGPFQGKVACTRISLGRGVCGTAAAENRTIIVRNVAEFPGHIYCDPDSKSEIVVPIARDGEVFGVLDLDSAAYGSFDSVDEKNLERVASLVEGLIGSTSRRR